MSRKEQQWPSKAPDSTEESSLELVEAVASLFSDQEDTFPGKRKLAYMRVLKLCSKTLKSMTPPAMETRDYEEESKGEEEREREADRARQVLLGPEEGGNGVRAE